MKIGEKGERKSQEARESKEGERKETGGERGEKPYGIGRGKGKRGGQSILPNLLADTGDESKVFPWNEGWEKCTLMDTLMGGGQPPSLQNHIGDDVIDVILQCSSSGTLMEKEKK